MENILHARDDIDSDRNHQLFANGTAELWEKLFFVDARATIMQVNASLTGPRSVSNINTTGNRSTAKTFMTSPYFRHEFANDAEGEARYTYSVVDTDSTTLTKTDSNRLDLKLKSGPSYRLYTWNVEYKKERIEGTRQASQEFSSILLTGRRLITYNLYLTSSIGYEDNHYVAVGNNPSGAIYNAGLDWTPSPRTHLAATLGQRYYCNAYSFDFSHRTRLTVWSARYSEDVTTTRSQLLLPVSTSTADYVNNLLLGKIPDPVARQQAVQKFISDANLPPSLLVPQDFYSTQVFLVKRWDGSVGLQGVRHTVLANAYTQTQDSQSASVSVNAGDFATSNNIKQSGASVTWSWRVTPYDSSNVSLAYSRNELLATGREDKTKHLRVSLLHQFDRNLSGSLNFRRLQNESSVPGSEYTENAVSAQLQMNF
jgi:uncharacterized protein (PEP-CTERM system associated)